MDDWVIIGGGPHGVCAARALKESGASVRIVEPSGELMRRWSDRAGAVAMAWMRSPLMHHLDAQPVSLDHFLHRPENADVRGLAGIFRRPTHGAFLRHSMEVVATSELQDAVVAGRVESIVREGEGLVVRGEGVELRARRVLVATGSNQPRWPDWARALRADGAPIHHAFDGDAPLHHDLVGGGISAVQRGLMVQKVTRRTVRLWMRRPVTESDFDFDRAWTKHRFMGEWNTFSDEKRLDFLGRNELRGSVPEGLVRRLERALRQGKVLVEHCIPEVEWDRAAGSLTLRAGERSFESSGLTLVTGFEPEGLPDWLLAVAEELGLETVGGLPRLAQDMEWGHGIHICGPLARLRLGPMAPNLVGARWATSHLPGIRMQPV